jgi:hypothetical protein
VRILNESLLFHLILTLAVSRTMFSHSKNVTSCTKDWKPLQDDKSCFIISHYSRLTHACERYLKTFLAQTPFQIFCWMTELKYWVIPFVHFNSQSPALFSLSIYITINLSLYLFLTLFCFGLFASLTIESFGIWCSIAVDSYALKTDDVLIHTQALYN